ncbi:hypothetical protein EBOKLHFM_00189 [Klebsiella phage KP13-26]|uniref:Uncharacterized protein n=1 Tax=Klebsiella phage FKP3 TaxID=3231233 RepID=A0AAU8I048_9CAUD|nr:hypothetical protein EBOKLHFM_00189 [Klebsiella phage KP13-26]
MLVAADLVPMIRILVFNPSQEVLPDEIVEQIIQTWIDIIGNNDSNKCAVLWNSLISVLEYLWNTDLLNHNDQTGGAISRKEKVGEIQVEVVFSNGQSEYHSPWEDIYNGYLNGDMMIPGCASGRGVTSKILVGGVDAREIERVNSDPNSVNGLGGVASVDRNTRNINYLRNYGPVGFYRRDR